MHLQEEAKSSWVQRLQGWRDTPVLFWTLLFEAAFELTRSGLIIGMFLRRSLPALLEVPVASSSCIPENLRRDIPYVVMIAGRHLPWRSLCLSNAIAAKRMLQRRGYDATLHLGVGFRENGALHAHAWLSSEGIVLIGSKGIEDVSALPSLPALPASR